MALATAFKSSLLESFEIAIVVIGLGTAGGRWAEAIGGALVAAVMLVLFAFWFRASLEKVPVKPAKFIAASLLMGFGTYWVGEGVAFGWPGGMLSLIWLTLLWGLLMAGGSMFLRSKRGDEVAKTPGPRTREGHGPPSRRDVIVVVSKWGYRSRNSGNLVVEVWGLSLWWGLRGMVVVITGAGGIGSEIASAFAREGCRVAVCDRLEDRLESVVGDSTGCAGEDLHDGRRRLG